MPKQIHEISTGVCPVLPFTVLCKLVSGFPITFKKKKKELLVLVQEAEFAETPVSGVRGISRVTGLVTFTIQTAAASCKSTLLCEQEWHLAHCRANSGGQQENSGSFRGILGGKRNEGIKHIYKYFFLQASYLRARESILNIFYKLRIKKFG